MTDRTREQNEALIQEVLEVYPEKARKDRAKHLTVNDPSLEKASKCITSNRKSLPGVMTIRGCAYAGSRGVVFGPIKDMIHLSHGPVGCGAYSRGGRRNLYSGTTGVDSFATINFTSDYQEKDIVFGGDKKLEKLIDEIGTIFPLARGISIQSECPIGLIGDDIESVSKKSSAVIGKPVIPVRCEGFRGVSQSLGHHIANDAIRDWVLDKMYEEQFITAEERDAAKAAMRVHVEAMLAFHAAGIPTVVTMRSYAKEDEYYGARLVLHETEQLVLEKLRLWHATASTS